MTVFTIRELTGRHVLAIMIAFFGAMLLANGIFLYLALSTFNGQERDAYQKGLHYNERIEAARAQAALGWSHQVTLGADRSVTVAISDRGGKPVSGLSLSGEIGRPAADQFSQPLTFREKGSGSYTAVIEQLQPGNWVASISAARSSSGVYQIKERLWLNPQP